MVEINVIFLCMGRTIPSYDEMYIKRKVDGKKKVIFPLRFSHAHQIVLVDAENFS